MGPTAMSDIDAALADASRQAGPTQLYEEAGSRGRPTQARGRLAQIDLQRRPAWHNTGTSKAWSLRGMMALPSRSTEAGNPDHAPSTIEGADAQALLGRPPILHGEDERA